MAYISCFFCWVVYENREFINLSTFVLGLGHFNCLLPEITITLVILGSLESFVPYRGRNYGGKHWVEETLKELEILELPISDLIEFSIRLGFKTTPR